MIRILIFAILVLTSVSVPICFRKSATWNAGHGTCATYVSGKYMNYCYSDSDGGLFAYQVCKECGVCQDPGSVINDGYEDVGMGYCVDVFRNYPSTPVIIQLDYYYSYSETPASCRSICSANSECLGYDVWKLGHSMMRCNLYVSDGNAFASGDPAGFTRVFFAGSGEKISGASESHTYMQFFSSCRRKVNQDCIGSWSTCTSACEKSGQRTFLVTQAQRGIGKSCPTTAPDCAPGQGSCTTVPCDCSCYKPSPNHPLWHGYRAKQTHCEAAWGNRNMFIHCPNVVGNAWTDIAKGQPTCTNYGHRGCCNVKCCPGSGPNPNSNPVNLISAGKSATSSALYHGAGRSWPASNALKDSSNLGQLGYDCAWHNPGSVAIHGAPAGTTLWWQVDLEKDFEVTRIKLRGFNLPGYSSNVQFKVCSDAAGLVCTTCGGVIAEPANTWKEVTCNSLVGRYVRLTHQTIDARNWHFCRVEVYGREK